MKLKLIILTFFCAICSFGYAQIISIDGKIIDAQTHQPVPFATLGIKGKNIGTVADENGVFHFKADAGAVAADDPLIVSSIGYAAVTIPFGKFKQGIHEISLAPLSTVLSTVTVKPDKFKTKIFGRRKLNFGIMTANMFTERDMVNDNLGKEQAAIITIDKHCYLREFNMLVGFNNFENVKFRLNFYNVKDGQPGQLIVNKDILFDVAQKSGWLTGKSHWLKVDLTKYNIYLEGYKKIAVAIQWVRSVKNDTIANPGFAVWASLDPFHEMYFRYKSQAEWKKISAYVTFNIVADSFNPGKEKDNQEEDKQADEAPVLNDSLKRLVAAEKSFQEAAASGYGNNSALGKYIHLPDANIYYEAYGSGEPLLLLHGNGTSISSFYKQIPELAKHYQVIAVDTRAQGKSTDASMAPLTYDKFADDMKALLDSLNIKQANILGWSDGGNTGLIMAFKYPTYVNKLIVMGAVLSPNGIVPLWLKRFQDRYKQIKVTASSPTSQRLLALLATEPHISDNDLQQIQAPVLVVVGENDIVVPEHTKEIATNIKHSKLLIIEGATHYAPDEKPMEFNQAALDFFKE